MPGIADRFEVNYSARALDDLDRVFDFLAETDPDAAGRAAALIADAVSMLAVHPRIGHPVRGTVRALIVSHGRTGYVALYRVVAAARRVDVLSIRHQREAGFG